MRITDMARKSTNEVDFLARIFWPESLPRLARKSTSLAKKSTSLARKSTSLARKSTSFFEVDFLARIFWPESVPQNLR